MRPRRSRALEPVDRAGRDAGGAAQVAQQVGRPAGAELAPRAARSAAPPTRGRGDRQLGLERDRDPVGLEHEAISGPRRAGSRSDDRDLVRVGAVGEQPRDLGARSPPPRRARRPSAGGRGCRRARRRAGSAAPKPRSRWKSSGLLGVAGVGVGRVSVVDADLARAGSPSSAARAPRAPRCRPRRGARRSPRSRAASARDQLELLRGSGRRSRRGRPAARPRGVRRARSSGDRLAGDAVAVGAAEPRRAPRA